MNEYLTSRLNKLIAPYTIKDIMHIDYHLLSKLKIDKNIEDKVFNEIVNFKF
jgi:hypothetical protein